MSTALKVAQRAYEAHIITKQTASILFVLLPKKLDSVSLILTQICVDGRRYLNMFDRVKNHRTETLLRRGKRERRPAMDGLDAT
jgi:hypothetical protein